MPISAILPVAAALALALMPLAIRLAWVTGFLDHPEARKLHTSATALLGGAAIFVAALGTVVLGGVGHGERWEIDAVALMAGGLLALLVGLWDDRFGMQPVAKMVGQALAVALLLASVTIPDLRLGTVGNTAMAIFVLIALMNAINFLDNMNGVVAGMSAIALAGFAWSSALRGSFGVAAVQLALAGGCMGFLPYNFPRARIFLGDAGSLFLGYSLAASAVLAFEGGPQGWGQLGPVITLAYPAFDMIFVVATRMHDGRKVSQGGKDHSTHRLARVLRCQTRTVLLLWLGGAALSVSGFVVQSLNQPMPTLLLLGLWLALFLWVGMRLSSVPIEASPALPTKS